MSKKTKVVLYLACAAIVASDVWGFFYVFHLFPWINGGFEWWYLPQLITACCVASAIFYAVAAAVDRISEM